jgi:hypothetical protein
MNPWNVFFQKNTLGLSALSGLKGLKGYKFGRFGHLAICSHMMIGYGQKLDSKFQFQFLIMFEIPI